MKSVCVFFAMLVGTCLAQTLPSPCPKILHLEKRPGEPDKTYGTATLTTPDELSGLWFRVILNKPALQLGNWFSEVRATDNNTIFIINDRNFKFEANKPTTIKFYIKYNPNDASPPTVISLKINGRSVCPEGMMPTTPPPKAMGQLFTNAPSLNNPVSFVPAAPAGGGGSGGGNQNSIPIGPVFQKPSSNGNDEFYMGDYGIILRPEDRVIVNATCGVVVAQPRPLITHGQDTVEGEFPWHAALYHTREIDLTYICGGSLISPQHVLTVAHCVTRRKSAVPLSSNNLVVYLGKYYLKVWKLNPGLQDRQIDKIIVHQKYDPQSFSNDIAVLTLGNLVDITNYVRPVCLWAGPTHLENVVNQLGTVVGWGFDENGKVTEQLSKAYMPIVSQETCIYSFPDFYSRFTSSNTFCAGFQNGTSVCNGDSGGGLILPVPGSDPKNPVWQIRGLISISVALQNRFRCDATHYVVFTDVAKYLDWVNKAMAS